MATTKGNIEAFEMLSKQVSALRTTINQLNFIIKDESNSFELRSTCRTLRDQTFKLLFNTVHAKKEVLLGEAQMMANVVFGRDRVTKFDKTLDDASVVAGSARNVIETFSGKDKPKTYMDFANMTRNQLYEWMGKNDPEEVYTKSMASTMACSPDTIMTYMPQFVPRLVIAIRLFTQVTTWVDRLLIVANVIMDFKVFRALSKDIMRAIQTVFMSAWTNHYGEESLPRATPNQDKEGRTTIEGEPQMEDMSKVVLAILMIGGTIVYGHTPPQAALSKSMDQLGNKFRNLGNIGNGIRGAFTIFDTLVQGIDLVVKNVADYIAPHWHPLSCIQEKKEEILQWMKAVSEIDSDHTRLAVTTHPDLRNDIFILRDKGDMYFDWFNRMPKGGQQLITGAFLKSHSAIIKLSNEVARAPLNVVARTDPFCFCLYGEKGTGKSFLLPQMINRIADRYGIAAFRRIYPREMAEKYWSDYSHQFAVALDDFAQVVNPVLFDPYFEFIQLKSNVPKILPMADINEKGRAFTSKLIGMTTNVSFPKPANVADHDALYRRRDLMFRVVKKHKVDLMTIDIGSTEHLEFFVMDSEVAGAPEHGPLKYEEAEELLITRCIAHLERQKLVVRYLNVSQLRHLEEMYVSKGDTVTKHLVSDMGYTINKSGFVVPVVQGEAQADDLENDSGNDSAAAIEELDSDGEIFHPRSQYPPNAIKYLDDYGPYDRLCIQTAAFPHQEGVCYCAYCCYYGAVQSPFHYFTHDQWEVVSSMAQVTARRQLQEFGYKRCQYYGIQVGDHVISVMNSIHYKNALKIGKHDWTTYLARLFAQSYSHDIGVTYRGYPIHNAYKNSDELLGIKFDTVLGCPWWAFTDYRPKTRDVLAYQSSLNVTSPSMWVAMIVKDIVLWIRSQFSYSPHSDYDIPSWLFAEWGEEQGDDPIVTDIGPEYDIVNTSPTVVLAGADGNFATIEKVITCQVDASGSLRQTYDFDRPKCDDCPIWKRRLCTEEKCDLPNNPLGCWYYLHVEWDQYKRDCKDADKHTWLLGAWELWSQKEKYCKASVKKEIQLMEAKAKTEAQPIVFEKIERSFTDYIKEWWDKYLKWRKEHPYLNAIVQFFALWAVTYPLVKMMQPDLAEYQPGGKYDTTELQNKEYHRGETRFRPMRRPVRGAPIHGDAHALHKELDANASEMVKNRIFPKIFRLTVLKGGKEPKYGQNCFQLYGRVILANKHFFNHTEVGDVLELVDMQGITFTVPYEEKNLWKSAGDDDLAGYFCDMHIPAGKDNRKCVITDADLAYLERFPATVCFQDSDGTAFYYDAYARPMEHDVALAQERIMLRNGWYLDVASARGQCGGILTVMNSRCPRKIAGMHAAGVCKNTIAVSQLLTQELLKPMYDFMSTKIINYITPPPIPDLKLGEEQMEECPDFGNIEVLGVIKDRAFESKKHHIVPSIVHDEIFQHETEPSVLSKRDPRLKVDVDPMHKGIAKYGNVEKPYPQVDVDRAVQDLKRVVLAMKPDRRPRVLTYDEAINGLPLDHFDRLDMQTSPGYPYTQRRPPSESGKKWLFRDLNPEGEPCYEIDDAELKDRLDRRLELAKQGQRIESQWSAQLKSERRPLEKIELGKTRVFTMWNVDGTLASRMYFLDFCALLMKNRQRSFHSVGIDSGSSDWAQLYWYLLEMAGEGFDGDHENFDGKFMIQWYRGILEVVNAFYDDGPTNALVRAVLVDEMIHKHVRVQNWLLYIHVGMPSGVTVTAIFNSCGNELEIKVVWLGLAKQFEPNKANLVDYHSNVRPNVFGDDNLMTVRRAVQGWFNAITYSEYLAKFGRKYTPAQKDHSHVKVRPLQDLRFLKRGFRIDPHTPYRVYAPIENRTVRELMNWVTDRTDPVEQLQLNYVDAQRFMFHTGNKSYSDFRALCDPILRKHNVEIPAHDYQFFEDEFEASYGVPTS